MKKAYLELLLKETIVEGHQESSFFSHKARTSLYQIVETLHEASRDPRIVALSLTIDRVHSGWAALGELRRALAEFRRSGKRIYCCMLEGANSDYYLASACDLVFMPPAGRLGLVGLSAETFFFRELLDRFGVKARLESAGEYKSAGEMFTRTGMSGPAREQLEALLDDIHEDLCSAIQGRGFTREQVAQLIDGGPYTAREALERKLLDGICYQDEIVDKLKEAFGAKIRSIEAAKRNHGEGFLTRLFTFRRPRVAVIEILGRIDVGESRRGQTGGDIAGADTVQRFLDHAERSRRIRAVVLRIDSPGGSGLASDLIWRKVTLLGRKKPVVVSFGNVAASGGYYISTHASCIVAESTSITGSIGVIAGKFVARELMQRLMVHRESAVRGAHAENGSPFSEFTPEEEERLKRQIDEFYREDFVRKVADGRKMTEAAVDEAGRGRVWSGRRALELNLVDEIGGVGDAIRKARELAGVPAARKARVAHYHRRRKLWERLLPDFRTPIGAAILGNPALSFLDAFPDEGLLLLMPFHIRIR